MARRKNTAAPTVTDTTNEEPTTEETTTEETDERTRLPRHLVIAAAFRRMQKRCTDYNDRSFQAWELADTTIDAKSAAAACEAVAEGLEALGPEWHSPRAKRNGKGRGKIVIGAIVRIKEKQRADFVDFLEAENLEHLVVTACNDKMVGCQDNLDADNKRPLSFRRRDVELQPTDD